MPDVKVTIGAENQVDAGAQAALKSVDKFNNAVTQRLSNNRGLAGAALQVQDIAVQLQQGTKFATILGQQGSQLLSNFGPAGAIAGGAVAIGAALYTVAANTKAAEQAAERYADHLKDAEQRSERIAKLQNEAAVNMQRAAREATPQQKAGSFGPFDPDAAADALKAASDMEAEMKAAWTKLRNPSPGVPMSLLNPMRASVPADPGNEDQIRQEVAAIRAKYESKAAAEGRKLGDEREKKFREDEKKAQADAGKALNENMESLGESFKVQQKAQDEAGKALNENMGNLADQYKATAEQEKQRGKELDANMQALGETAKARSAAAAAVTAKEGHAIMDRAKEIVTPQQERIEAREAAQRLERAETRAINERVTKEDIQSRKSGTGMTEKAKNAMREKLAGSVKTTKDAEKWKADVSKIAADITAMKAKIEVP